MTPAEINETRRLVGAYPIKRTQPFEDATGLASAPVRRCLATFEDSLDDYAASWNASSENPDSRICPEWSALSVDTQAHYIGLEIAQCIVAMLDRIEGSEGDIHDVMPEAWEINDEA
ncbi:hypothetical protein DMP06_00070 [Slackia equolifaciens]|uniref:Uncharacterized protein n=1 Tax=Slackia equolifaciens TaxID=498718 RepID=A0A3N0B411_9ACTN|nr:hypothetical protein [Slackia equolifaciens]RNL41851.1 hypothetical protein DMP06_00070 [Slackia equolifaciens]